MKNSSIPNPRTLTWVGEKIEIGIWEVSPQCLYPNTYGKAFTLNDCDFGIWYDGPWVAFP